MSTVSIQRVSYRVAVVALMQSLLNGISVIFFGITKARFRHFASLRVYIHLLYRLLRQERTMEIQTCS
jgi:hypothetical protein